MQMRVNMKKMNRVFRKQTGRRTAGVSIIEKAVTIISACGEDVPITKADKVSLSNDLLRMFNKSGCLKSEISSCAPVHSKKPIKSGSRKAKSNSFYASWEWKQARYEALQLHGRQCMCCGWSPEPGSKGHLCVDHIKPRSRFPALALDVSNLQVLCNSCNMGKSNVHQDDFRAEWHGEEDEADPLTAQFNATMQ